jgi:hypothetical protein
MCVFLPHCCGEGKVSAALSWINNVPPIKFVLRVLTPARKVGILHMKLQGEVASDFVRRDAPQNAE